MQLTKNSLGIVPPHLISVPYVCPLLRLCDFTIGCITGLLFLRSRERAARSERRDLLELTAFAVTIGSILYQGTEHTTLPAAIAAYPSVLYVPSAVLPVWVFAEKKGLLTTLLTNKALMYIGDISPYAYLIHQRVIKCLKRLFSLFVGSPLNVWLYVISAAFITWGAVVIYRRIDLRSRNRIPQR